MMPTTAEMPKASPSAAATPSRPPRRLSTVASVRNCATMSRRLAPIARRMPISWVRSRTATSITLAMPIPPTTRLMAAIAVISLVKFVGGRLLRLDQAVGVDDQEVVVLVGSQPVRVAERRDHRVAEGRDGVRRGGHADLADVGVGAGHPP